MRNAENTITIYSAYYDNANGCDEYKRNVLAGVSWFNRTQTTVSVDGGLIAANEFTVRIPSELCSGYVEPKSYTGAVNTWTLCPGDIIVKGMATETNPLPKDLFKAYNDVFTIVGVTDSRRGRGAHIKVVGK